MTSTEIVRPCRWETPEFKWLRREHIIPLSDLAKYDMTLSFYSPRGNYKDITSISVVKCHTLTAYFAISDCSFTYKYDSTYKKMKFSIPLDTGSHFYQLEDKLKELTKSQSEILIRDNCVKLRVDNMPPNVEFDDNARWTFVFSIKVYGLASGQFKTVATGVAMNQPKYTSPKFHDYDWIEDSN